MFPMLEIKDLQHSDYTSQTLYGKYIAPFHCHSAN